VSGEHTVAEMIARLTDAQLSELERQLAASVDEWVQTEKNGPAHQNLAFKAEEYIGRLLNDVKHYRAALAETAAERDLLRAEVDDVRYQLTAEINGRQEYARGILALRAENDDLVRATEILAAECERHAATSVRLRAINAELLAALQNIIRADTRYELNVTSQDTGYDGPSGKIARAAIAKAVQS
jgi:uncharacterized coiled-coil DUF342 family protein